jgi:tetratricopeptide (TPR) repeat protein
MTLSNDLPDIDSLWNYGDPAASEQAFRSLLRRAPRRTGYRVEVLTQIARAQGLQRRFDAANETLNVAERELAKAGRPPRAAARIRLERGRVLNSARRPAEAAPHFQAALDLAAAAGEDFYAVDAAHMLGICEPPERRTEWHLRALEMAERATQPRARNWLGSLYNNLGWTLHDQGDYAAALDLFEKALRFREAQGSRPEILVARWCVARAQRSLGQVEAALAAQRELAAERERLHEPDGFVLEEIAECLLLLGRPDEARPYFAQAYAQLAEDPWLADNEPERLVRLKSLS